MHREPFALLATQDLDPNQHGAIACAVEMTLVHNCFIRAVNSIYYHAPYVTLPNDVADFLRFCAAFVGEINTHHDLEETVIFPMWIEATNSPHIMDSSTAEHAAFHDGLARLMTYATTTEVSAYQSSDLLAIMDSFTPALMLHLRSEISVLLGMQKYDGDKLLQTFRDGVKAAVGTATKDEQFPFIFSCNDVTFEGGKHHFPPVPWVVNFVVKWWYARRYQGAWRFSPSDMYGRPKKSEFGPEASGQVGRVAKVM